MMAGRLLGVATLAALAHGAYAFERPGAASGDADGSMDNDLAGLMQKAGLGDMGGDQLREAMQAMMGGAGGAGMGMEGLGKMMQDMMSNPQMLEQVQQAMSDPDTQRQMLDWANKVQEEIAANPQLQALAKQFENMDPGGKMLEALQNDPKIQEMAEKLKSELGGLADGGDDADKLQQAINVGQEVFQKMMSDPEYLQQFGETMKQMLPPDALANMEEQIKAAMGEGGMPDLEQLQAAMAGLGKDEL